MKMDFIGKFDILQLKVFIYESRYQYHQRRQLIGVKGGAGGRAPLTRVLRGQSPLSGVRSKAPHNRADSR